MTDTSVKTQDFRSTIYQEREISRIESNYYSGNDLIFLFDRCPTFKIRKAVLNYLLDHSVKIYSEDFSSWMETRIYDLKKEEEETSSGFWEDLLRYYVFNASAKLVNRAIAFAIEITEKPNGFLYASDILKSITSRLEKTPAVYDEVETPALRLFLQSFLVKAYQPNYMITDITMVDIRRVINCVTVLEDWQFQPLIEKVLYQLANQKRSKKYNFKEEAEIKENIAFLREAAGLFREKLEELEENKEKSN